MALNKVGSGVGLFFELFSSALRVPGLSVRSGHLCSAFYSKLVLATPAGLVIPRFIFHSPGATLQLRRGRGQNSGTSTFTIFSVLKRDGLLTDTVSRPCNVVTNSHWMALKDLEALLSGQYANFFKK